jgi:hypothetical protein
LHWRACRALALRWEGPDPGDRRGGPRCLSVPRPPAATPPRQPAQSASGIGQHSSHRSSDGPHVLWGSRRRHLPIREGNIRAGVCRGSHIRVHPTPTSTFSSQCAHLYVRKAADFRGSAPSAGSPADRRHTRQAATTPGSRPRYRNPHQTSRPADRCIFVRKPGA